MILTDLPQQPRPEQPATPQPVISIEFPSFETYRKDIRITNTLTECIALIETSAEDELFMIKNYIADFLQTGYSSRIVIAPSMMRLMAMVSSIPLFHLFPSSYPFLSSLLPTTAFRIGRKIG